MWPYPQGTYNLKHAVKKLTNSKKQEVTAM